VKPININCIVGDG